MNLARRKESLRITWKVEWLMRGASRGMTIGLSHTKKMEVDAWCRGGKLRLAHWHTKPTRQTRPEIGKNQGNRTTSNNAPKASLRSHPTSSEQKKTKTSGM